MSLRDDVGGQVVVVMVVMIVTVMVVKMMIDAGQGMYYDKAFEQTQKTGGCVVKVPEPTKVVCLYDLHFKYASRGVVVTIINSHHYNHQYHHHRHRHRLRLRRCHLLVTLAAASLRIKGLSRLSGRYSAAAAAAADAAAADAAES